MRRLLSIPNLLSLARIVLTPFAVAALVQSGYLRAVVIIAVAGLTDAFDGMLARRFGWETRFGAILDPIADKLMLVAVYLGLGLSGLAPAWLVWIVLGRDVLILAAAGVAMLVAGHRRFPPSGLGKVSTIMQMLTAAVLIAGPAFGSTFLAVAGGGLVWAAAVATVASGIDYGWRGRRLFREPLTGGAADGSTED